jgi:ligand-binding SRPBCC domain-containing protein
MTPYSFFEDEMVSGDFKQVKHKHHFKPVANGTIMIDYFHFETPYGNVGKFFNKIYLTSYLKNLLENRNLVIKEYAETKKWQGILENSSSYQSV